MINTIIFPTLKRKEFPDVMKVSYNSMGLLAVNHFSQYKDFLKLFFDQIESKIISGDFRDFEMVSLFVIFDALLQNNITQNSVSSFLYFY